MSSITTTGRAAYRGGASHTGYLAGFETANKLTRVLRYTFTTPADGVSKLSITGAHLAHSASYSWSGLDFYITTSATSHVNAGAGSVSQGTLIITGNGKDYDISTGEINVNLPGNVTAYVYIFPNNTSYFLWNFVNVTALSISTEPGASTIASCPTALYTLDTLAIAMRRAGDSFCHRATFKCGNTPLYTSELFGESLSVTVPRAWLAEFTDKPAISVSVSIQTYADLQGTITAGEPVTAEIKITADANMRPAIQEGGVSVAAYNAGAAAGMTGYIRGFSRVEATVVEANIDLSACAGASIAEYKLVCAGAAVTSTPYRSPILTDDATAVFTVTDSRGRSASASFQISTIAYAAPTLTATEIFRCDASGTANDDEGYISVKTTPIFSSVEGQNTCKVYAALAEESGNYGSDTEITAGSANVLYGTLSPDKTYRVRLTVRDTLGGERISTTKLPTRVWAMKFRESGLGIGFGMAPQHDKAIEVPEDWSLRIGTAALTQTLIAALGNLIDLICPVGIYVWLAAETDPADIWGGTWVRQTEGLTLVSAGDKYPLNSTGGEAAHTLTEAEMPKHSHVIYWGNATGEYYTATTAFPAAMTDSKGDNVTTSWGYEMCKTAETGSSEAHNNMMPYKAAYCWLRTA